ncbi:MAG TPA: right-handed parallel beta-helix repeat-containing protein [Chitinivibrionales bacterium]|nr:right-handed parallel beta-helix repeat-containing protein [Chitinivibrionales bacterium]
MKLSLPVLLFCSIVCAATYYVDQSASNSADANPGTAAQPWKTISKAAAVAVAGDSVIVKSGTYNERISFTSGHSGSIGKKIVFKADPRRTVFMQGFNTGSANYLRVEGFDITYSQGGWNGGGVWISSSNLEIVDNYCHDIPGPGIQSNWSGGPWDSVYIGANHVHHCQYGITVTGTNFLVEGNEVDRLFQYDTTDDCDYSRFFGDSIMFRHNYFHGTVFSEVGSAHLDCWQTFDNNGEHAANITWDGNWCSECDEGLMAEGIYHHNNHDFTFKNNIFAHSAAWGLCVSDGITNIFVYNNTFYDIKYYGAGFGGSFTSGAIVKNNIFSKCYDHAIIVNNGAAPVTEDYNLFNASTYAATGGHDKMNVDPQFVDSANNNFRITSTSPAVDAGTTLPVATDYDGTARPYNGVFDIGAFEFSNSAVRGFSGQRDFQALRPMIQNPITPALLKRCLQNNVDLTLYDCAGKRLFADRIDRQGTCIVKSRTTGAIQKIIVVK